jgi:thiamine biosynthesis lipoprotein
MEEYSFEALGTKWSLLSDEQPFSQHTREQLWITIASFEERFSRFRDTSEVNTFREASAGVYTVSDEFAELLTRADVVRQLTGGRYDPASGVILEHYGYDKEYSFIEGEGEVPTVPSWSLAGNQLHLTGPTAFDLGGIGKGYAIDTLTRVLEKEGFRYYLIDGGGDMYATSKADGSAYTVALEWPGRPGVSYGTVALRRQGLAVSDTATRRFGDRHHIVNALDGANSSKVLGVAVVAENAWDADCATAALIQWPGVERRQIEQALHAQSVIITTKEEFLVSQVWPGEVFTSH